MNSYPIHTRFRGYLPVVIDIETAGFNPATDALLEIACIPLGMDESGMLYQQDSLHANIHPFAGANLNQAALDFTGIDPYDPKREALTELEVIDSIIKPLRKDVKSAQCKRAILVAHNASFDQSFLHALVERTGYKNSPFHPFSTFDTVTLAGMACGHTVLAKACEIIGIDFDNKQAHSALYDATKTAELFCQIINHWQRFEGSNFNYQHDE